MKPFAAMLLWLFWVPMAVAQTAQPMPDDPVANKRAVQLAEHLRCLVCQNQSLADSHADLAVDLRRQIREQIAQGKSDAEITGFMVDRYGDFILYSPPVKATTLLLWFGPPTLLLLGFLALFRYLRIRRKRVTEPPLSEEQRRHARALLNGEAEGQQ